MNRMPREEQQFAIYHNLWIDARPDAVFRAVSLPEELVNWWPKICEGTPAAGGAYHFYFSDEYDWYGRVLEYTEPERFSIAMTQADEDWSPTCFGFELLPSGTGTEVHFFHEGWPACNAHYKRSNYCWAILLLGLKNYVEQGIILPFEERE